MLRAFGKFHLIRPLGRGAMGEVYLAEDQVIGRRVAIKTIRPADAGTEEARSRFLREARAAGALNHPNLVTIHEFGELEGSLYLAMEYVEGQDLERLFEEKSLSAPELLETLAQVCDGLAYAHGKGVIHRDIKPSNIRVVREKGRLVAKVMDFGIARVHNSEMTGTGTLLGTFGYMAPEYVQTGKPDARSDLFAVGVILYEALAGRRPFEGDTTATILYRLVHEEPAPLDMARLPGLNPHLSDLLRRALAKNPAFRFQDGAAMAKALRDAKDPGWGGPVGEEATSALPTRPAMAAAPPRPEPAPPPPAARKTPRLILPAALAVALTAAGAGAWRIFRSRPAQIITLPPPQPAAVEPPPAKTEPRTPLPAPTPAPRPVLKKDPPSRRDPVLTPEEAEAWLNDAAFGLSDTPERSLKLIGRVLQDQPALPRARALQVAGLYYAGRYQDMPAALRSAKEAGLAPRQFVFYGAFQTMMRAERVERRIPEDVRVELAELFPKVDTRPRGRFPRPFGR